ncbi:Coiled-coil domain-containing protein 13 [Boothiomyces macroporosus]|uniref:Coiled-coil domain-containing protein 13 n=1 Tax=Boothiomyces macroporosus TaxID=261099 RepID=A0AAD5Y3Q2_9FUNG|nr:Coiled-coil domain-containing protein 13 [Boothiomyces macroporosus]
MLAPLGNYKVGLNTISTPKLNRIEKKPKYQNTGKLETLTSDESQDEDVKSLHSLILKNNKPLDIIREDIVEAVSGNSKSDNPSIIDTLRREMKAKDVEIKSLRKELLDGISTVALEDTISDSLQNSNAQNAKIIELAKKARRLTVQYEKEKTKNIMLLARIKELENPQVDEDKAVSSSKPTDNSMKEKLFYSMRKLEEERMHNQTLKQEVRNLTRILQREVGDTVPTDQLLKGETNWKGRSEQIIILKEKIKELQKRLQNETKANSPIPRESMAKPNKMEDLKRKDLERALSEAEKYKSDYIELKKRVDGMQSRIKILEFDNKEYRSKIKILLDKSENDDKLITALKQELKKQKKNIEQKNTAVFQNLKAICAEQQETIHTLETKITDMGNIPQTDPTESPDTQDLQNQISKFTLLVDTFKNEIKQLRESKSELEKQLESEKSANYLNKIQLQKIQKPEKNSDKKSKHSLKDTIAILTDENEALKSTVF